MRPVVLALVALVCACPAATLDAADPVPDVSGTTPQVAELLRARVDATNRQDWEAWQALHTEDCVRTAPELQEPLRGAPAMRAAVERLGNAFPDYHVALVRAVGQGPWVAALFQARGTMKHALHVPGAPPIPPTHREFRQTWTAFMRLEGDHLAEFHEHYDQTDLNNQLLGVAGPKSW